MIIKNLKFKNFRSYGHIEQVINFNDDGGLIGVVGESGSGKTVIKEVFEYVLFGKVRSRRKPDKNSKLKNLPNRRNKNLVCSIEIIKNDKKFIIERGTNPSLFKVSYGGKSIDDNKQILIERILSINLETYHSFISFSQSDVLNFISLSKKDADDVINKLFNYEYILNLSDKIHNLNHHNSLEKQKKDLEKNQLQKDLLRTNKKLDVIEKNKDSIDSNILLTNKSEYLKLNDNKKDLDLLDLKLIKENEEALNKYYDFNSVLKDLKDKIKLYDDGVCPYCKNELNDSENIKIELNIKLNLAIKSFNKVDNTLKDIKNKTNNLKSDKNDIISKINSILIDTKTIKNTIDLQNKIALINQEDIIKDKDSFETSLTSINNSIKKNDLQNIVYNGLQDILSLEGDLKQEVLKKALPKINSLIQKFVKELDFEYELIVENNLKVSIYQYGTLIDSDDPSNGEIKRANLIIMFAFIMYSSFKSKINFMFLDELLEGLDLKSTHKILKTLKLVTKDMNINMFLICHKLQDLSQFNKIINVKKQFFSNLSTVENNI